MTHEFFPNGRASRAATRAQRRSRRARGQRTPRVVPSCRPRPRGKYLDAVELRVVVAVAADAVLVAQHLTKLGAHVCAVVACGTIPRRGPLAALPGEGVWRHAWGDGANCPSTARHAPFNELEFAESLS
jgi:hypothetical protein